MDRTEIESKVKEIITERLGFKEGQITNADDLQDDLKADSLEIIDLVMEIEDQFMVKVPDEDLQNIKTVQDIIDYVAGQKIPGGS